MAAQHKMTTAEAVRVLRADPNYASVIRDSYLDQDVRAAAERFLQSAEFAEVSAVLGDRLRGSRILDLGAGVGMASYALARSGAGVVYALEPDPSDVVGRGAIMKLSPGIPIELLDGVGEEIPLPDEAVDVVYARQVLHHTKNVKHVMREAARVLRRGGLLLVCREHVVDDEGQLQQFLAEHPIHQLAGGEHAYPLDVYLEAIASAGLVMRKVFDPWDSIINAFPSVRTRDELSRYPDIVLKERFGQTGTLLRFVPGVRSLVWRRIRAEAYPGRLYSFLAVKS